MTVREMLVRALEQLGADGLCHPHEGCGCSIDDLGLCDAVNLRDCVAARRVDPPEWAESYEDDWYVPLDTGRG